MNLIELQEELRSIENKLSSLHMEIEKMKPQTEEEQKSNFKNITKAAAQHPIQNNVLKKASDSIKRAYIACLSYIIQLDEDKLYEKLLYLSRIANGMGTDFSSEDIFRMGMEMEQTYFEKACLDLKEQKYPFLTDALILVNIAGKAEDSLLSLIADLGEIMDCSPEDIYTISLLAKYILTENLDILSDIPAPQEQLWLGQFKPYIPEHWINSQRICCGKYCTGVSDDDFLGITDVYNISKKIPNCGVVYKGEAIAILDYQKTINAPCNGMVIYQESESVFMSDVKLQYTSIYVVSYFDDPASFTEESNKKEK